MRIENVRRQKLDGAQQTDRLIRAARRVFIDMKSSVDRSRAAYQFKKATIFKF
jgi:hypothetical protein